MKCRYHKTHFFLLLENMNTKSIPEPSESGYIGSANLSSANTCVTPTMFTDISDDRTNDFPESNTLRSMA